MNPGFLSPRAAVMDLSHISYQFSWKVALEAIISATLNYFRNLMMYGGYLALLMHNF